MENIDILKYYDILVRRKYWFLISFMVVILGGTFYLFYAPKIYESTTLILVQPQKVPQNFVQSIVSTDADDRLRTITQQVTSRTNLEGIIEEYKLFDSEKERTMLIDDKVALLREHILINVAARGVRGGNAFSISFQGEDPRKVMQVTNALASNFISENLKIRESQAFGTSSFLTEELDNVKKELLEKEAELKNYKEKHMGSLPDQLDTNLRILGNLQGEFDQLAASLNAAQDRKLVLQQGLTASSTKDLDVTDPDGRSLSGGQDSLPTLKALLASMLTRYTEKHPDVIELKKRIAALEEKMGQKSGTNEDMASSEETSDKASPSAESDQPMTPQLASANIEIARLKGEIDKVKKEIEVYQKRVEEIPKREQELLSLNRDYANLNTLYHSMLNKKYEASISVSMEKKQKGEQFRVIDPAAMPLRPVKPNIPVVISIIIALALGTGIGLIYLVELMDTSYRNPDDAEKDLSVPVLITMPFLMNEKEIKRKKIKNIIFTASLFVGFIILFAGIVLSAEGLDATVNYISGLFTGV